ncbi:MAG: response regulator, partial [Planctomycetes bacterium]|nr:response regulator [Planctomycetota bacterium]
VLRTGLPENLADQEHLNTPAAYWSYAMWAILGADEKPVGVMIRVTDATENTAFRQHATAMNEALLVSSVRQHELIDTIQRGEQDRHDLQARLFQAQKAESLGILAGGIAHDLNNILTPVVGYADFALSSLPEGSPVAFMLVEIGKNARRAADLVAQILAYAGKGRFVIQSVDLSEIVNEMRGLLGSTVSINAELDYDLVPALPLVEADATQLRQVVVNLVKNASEALEEGKGKITVRTGLIHIDRVAPDAIHASKDLSRGPHVFLEVADSGSGMTPEVIEKIFDPFFTTKFTGRGLGLAVVQGIARGHNWTLEIRSEPGKGSTFRLLLPCSMRINPSIVPALPPKQQGWRGTGTILVVDDEWAVREIVAHILKQAGLTVMVAEDGQECMTVFREHQQKFDAVILDVTMPNMNGLEVAAALRLVRPDLPIILMSGFSVMEVTLQSEGLGITGFVQKPFNAQDLLATVRLALKL